MLAWWSATQPEAAPPREAVLTALSRYEEAPARIVHEDEGTFLAAGPREACGYARGVSAALQGWIDNAAEIADELGLSAVSDGELYAAALAAWGEDAERRLIGTYSGVARLPDGTAHLARTPWAAPPLYYHCGDGAAMASPLFRVLFAAGAPRDLDRERLIDELAYDWHSGTDSTPWHGIALVPLGGIVRISAGRASSRVWYVPPRPMRNADYREAEAVARANALLDEAGAKAMAWAKRPALSLSGGLDSPLVASALVRALPAGVRLPTITFRPDRAWDGVDLHGTMGDEAPLVAALAAAMPELETHFTVRDIPPYDWRARDMYAAIDVLVPGLANTAMLHLVYAKARELGCDALLNGDYGNDTLSDAGGAAFCEYAREGRWRQLLGLLRNRADDDRPLWRRIVAMSVMPQLPAVVRKSVRRAIHRRRGDLNAKLTCLSPQAQEARRRRSAARGATAGWEDPVYERTRAEAVNDIWFHADGRAGDAALGFEQLYGIRKRDVLAYRPLIEFCMSLPTRAFAWDGQTRRLARLMGKDRLPAAISQNTLHGQHNADWFARLTRERPTLLDALDAAADDPWLAATLDLPRLRALVEDWPERPSPDRFVDGPRMLALPRALLTARFIGHIEGRNAL